MDWITNNLYWVDSVWARIEALNIDSLERAEVLRIGANSRPRAIAVDPNHRWEWSNAQCPYIFGVSL